MKTIFYQTQTELLEAMTARKADIAEADEKYQHAFARGDFEECGTHRSSLSRHRNAFAKLVKFKIKKGW